MLRRVSLPRWVLVTVILVTDAAAIWFGIRDAVAASFLLVLAGVSASLALTVRAQCAAAATLVLLVPAVFMTVMAGPGTTADCGPRCAALVDAHGVMVARVGWILAIGHVVALGPELVNRIRASGLGPRASA
jgi:hypothetical protein